MSAIVVDAANGTPEGGLIVEANDPDCRQEAVHDSRTFIALGGDQVGATVKDEDYNGTTITVVSLGDVAKLSGMRRRLGALHCPCRPATSRSPTR